jgi:hypothetical protein
MLKPGCARRVCDILSLVHLSLDADGEVLNAVCAV